MCIKIPLSQILKLSPSIKVRNELSRVLFGWEGFESRIKLGKEFSTLRSVRMRRFIYAHGSFILTFYVMQGIGASLCTAPQRRDDGSNTS